MLEQDPTMQPPGDVEHKEKEQVRHIIVVDDNYTENLAGAFDGEREESDKPQVDQAQDLEGALALIDSIKDTRGVGVMTDLFFPEKKGSSGQTEGLKVIQEMLVHFGLDKSAVQEMISNYRLLAEEVGVEKITRLDMTFQSHREIRRKVEDIFGVGDNTLNDPRFQDFFTKRNIYVEGGEVYLSSLNREFSRNSMNYQEEIEKGNVILQEETYIITEKGFQEYAEKGILPEDYPGSSKGFLKKLSYSLFNKMDGGVLMGVRVAEAAQRKNIPLVVITGGHGMGPVNTFTSKYLFDCGIISQPGVGNPSRFISMEQVKVDGPMGQKNVYSLDARAVEEESKKYTFFEASKVYDEVTFGDEGTKNTVTKNILQIIGKSLEAKIQEQKY